MLDTKAVLSEDVMSLAAGESWVAPLRLPEGGVTAREHFLASVLHRAHPFAVIPSHLVLRRWQKLQA